MSEENINNRSKNRHVYNKNILCFKCKNTGGHKVRVPFIITVKDISYGGIGIECQQMIPKGSIIEFQLSEDEGKRTFEIEVRWTKYENGRYQIGTKFINIVKEDVVYLFNMIQRIS